MEKVTLITGASSGIGMEFAKIFAREGHHLVISARSEKVLHELAEDLRKKYFNKVHVVPADLSHPDECLKLVSFCSENNLFVENLVNNAGFGDNESFAKAEWTKLEQMIRLNMESLTRLSHLFLPAMIQNRTGGILNVASTAAFQPGPFMAVYYATKAYVLSFSEALNEELHKTGVHVTALCPGPTRSGFQSTAQMDKAKLFNALRVPGSDVVAEYGYHSFMQKKAVAVHGLLNKIMVQSIRVSPRSLIVKIVRFLQGK